MSLLEKLVWRPQAGPQEALCNCPFDLIGYGGARGGGKTDGVIGKYGIKQNQYGKKFNAIFFRKEMPQADDLIERAKEIYLPIGAKYNGHERTFLFERGGRLRFRPLESEADAEKYQGQNLTDCAVEEAGNYSDSRAIFKLFGALRSTSGVPTQLILTFNPGGPGHHWLKELFVKPDRSGMTLLEFKLPTGKIIPYIYIRSLVQNNKILLEKDPGYIDRLHLVGSSELVRAWLEGDFDIHEGTYFPEFGQRHIVDPLPLGNVQHWQKYVGFDWGYKSPFCAVWGAISSGKYDNGNECPYPKGSIVIYRECWGKGVDNSEIAKKILELSGSEDPNYVGDPSIWNHQGGPSIGDQLAQAGVKFRPADNDRISGWAQIRARLKPNPAFVYIATSCPYLLESLPALAMDPKNAEDADSTGDDHAPDALRYLCKERLLVSILAQPVDPVRFGKVQVQAYIQSIRKNQSRSRI